MKLLAGSGIGLINGMVIAVGGLPAFVTTLGMMAVSNVLSLGTTGGATVSGFPKKFLRLGQGALQILLVPAWVAILIALTAHIALTRNTFGRQFYFLGSNEAAAVLSGIRVKRIKILVFMIASTLTAVSAVLELASLSVGQPSATGGCELLTIRAGVIGGVNLFGGVEILLGTTLGMTSC